MLRREARGNLHLLRTTDLLFANRETAEVTGVSYLTDGPDDVAKTILTS